VLAVLTCAGLATTTSATTSAPPPAIVSACQAGKEITARNVSILYMTLGFGVTLFCRDSVGTGCVVLVTSRLIALAVGCAKAAKVCDVWNLTWPPPVKEEGQIVSKPPPIFSMVQCQ